MVEDEDDLRRLIVRALCRLDYQVLEACTGEEAVEIVQKNNSTVHLLITDIVLPGIGGALDLIDSLLFTAPLLFFYLRLVIRVP